MSSPGLATFLALSWQGSTLPDGTADHACRALTERLARFVPPAKLAAWQADPAAHAGEIEQTVTAFSALDPVIRDLADRVARPPAAPAAGPASPPSSESYSVTINADHNAGTVAARDIHGLTVHQARPSEPAAAPPSPAPEKPAAEAVTILFVGANPREQTRLALDQEVREIDLALRQSEFRDRFVLQQHWAVRVTDLQGYLLRHRPHILHFSGHGGGEEGLFFEGPGDGRPLTGPVLARLLTLFRPRLSCVVLNACHSEEQAKAIAETIDCVVGTSGTVGDRAAALFAATFYQALAHGSDVQTAFELGRVQLDMLGVRSDRLQLLARNRVTFLPEM